MTLIFDLEGEGHIFFSWLIIWVTFQNRLPITNQTPKQWNDPLLGAVKRVNRDIFLCFQQITRPLLVVSHTFHYKNVSIYLYY